MSKITSQCCVGPVIPGSSDLRLSTPIGANLVRAGRAVSRLRGDLAVDLQFRHIVDDAEQLPLGVDLGFSAQRESTQAALLGVTEHRLDQAHALGVDRAAFGAVDLLAHGPAVREKGVKS